jgi:integrase
MSEPISEKIVAGLPSPASGNKLHYFSGATLQGKKAPSGFAVRVTAAGTKSFVQFYSKDGQQYLPTLGTWAGNDRGGKLTVLQAILKARDVIEQVFVKDADPRPERTRRDEDGNKPEGETVADVLDIYLHRYVRREAKLRSAPIIERTFKRLVVPEIGRIGIYDLRRKHLVDLLDKVADENGPVMADRTLAYLSKAFIWNTIRDEKFNSPIVRGMSRTKPSERTRDRVLSDDEIRDLWKALDEVPRPSCYARYVKFLLHTATRRNEAAKMRWDEVTGKAWKIPGARYKNKRDHEVPLTAAALKLIGDRPKDIAKHPFVFSTNGGELAFGARPTAARSCRIGRCMIFGAARDPSCPAPVSLRITPSAQSAIRSKGCAAPMIGTNSKMRSAKHLKPSTACSIAF